MQTQLSKFSETYGTRNISRLSFVFVVARKLDDGTLTTVYHFMKNSDTQIDEVLEDAKFENAEGIND